MAHIEAHNWRDGLTLLQRIKYMMEGQYACDVTLKVGQGKNEENIKAHSFMLIAGSPYFETLIKQETNAKQDALVLDLPQNPVIMKEIIKYFYCEEVDLRSSNILDILLASKKYEIPQLTQQCSQFLEANLTPENVSTMLTQSLIHRETKLADKCVELISQNAKVVFESVEFPSMSQAALLRVVGSDLLHGVTELDVYHSCLKWADQQCRDRGREASDTNRREVLADAIYQIRFPTMSNLQFAQLVDSSSLLTLSEQASIFQCIAYISADLTTSTTIPFNTLKRLSKQLYGPQVPLLSPICQDALIPSTKMAVHPDSQTPPSPPTQRSVGSKQPSTTPLSTQLSADRQAGQPQLSAGRQEDQPQLSADRQADQPQLSADRQEDRPQLSADRQADQPQLSAGRQEDQPQLLAGRQEDRPQLSADRQADQPHWSAGRRGGRSQLSAGRQEDQPQLSLGRQEDRPQLSADRQGGRSQLSADRQGGRSQLSADRQEDRPQMSAGRRGDQSQMSAGRQEDRSQLSAGRREDRSQLSAGRREDRPQLSAGRQEDRPQLSAGRRGDRSQLSAGRQGDRSQLSAGRREDRPQLSAGRRGDRSQLSAGRREDRSQLSAGRQEDRPQLSAGRRGGLSHLSAW